MADAGLDASNPSDAAIEGARPITIGQGFKPGVAVDAAGTAYISWYGLETVATSLHFCRLPRGARDCDLRTVIAAPGATLTRPFVGVSGSRVRVLSYRYGLTGDPFDAGYLYTSTDRGATFDPGQKIGSVPFNDAVPGPGDTVSLATDAYAFGEVFQNLALAGSAPSLPFAPRAILSTDHPYGGTVGLVDAATPLVAFADAKGNAQFRRYMRAGDPNQVTSWSAAQDIGHDAYMHLAGGPRGLFLIGRTAASTLEARRFDGATFAPGVNIPEGTGELPQSHLFQNAAGRLHAVWPRIDADGIRLYHAVSDDGASWRSGIVLTSPDAIGTMRVATAPDHVGVTTWEGPDKAVRVIGVGPDAPAGN